MLHTVLSPIDALSSVRFLGLKLRQCKKMTNMRCLHRHHISLYCIITNNFHNPHLWVRHRHHIPRLSAFHPRDPLTLTIRQVMANPTWIWLEHNRPNLKPTNPSKNSWSREAFDPLSRSPHYLVSSVSSTTITTFLIPHLKQHQNGRRPEISNEKPVLDENKKYYVR